MSVSTILYQSDVDKLIKQFAELKLLTIAQLSEQLSNVTIRADLQYVNLCNLRIQNTRFVCCNLNYLKLCNCCFKNVVFDFSTFNYSNCSSSLFFECQFTHVVAFASEFSYARFDDCHNANIKDTVIYNIIQAKQCLLVGITQRNCDEHLFYIDRSLISTNFSTNVFRYGTVLTQPLIGYKKAKVGAFGGDVLIKLEIPEGAIVFQPNNYKCRTNIAKVLRIYSMHTDAEYDVAHSMYNHLFEYKVGKIVKCNDFELNNTVECAQGIHFFMTETEAREYEF